MHRNLVKLDMAILKQAIRDLASKDSKLEDGSLSYFTTKSFFMLCQRNTIDVDSIVSSIKELKKYPLISRKKLANQIAKLIDNYFIK